LYGRNRLVYTIDFVFCELREEGRESDRSWENHEVFNY
jgi:hypothetical protein